MPAAAAEPEFPQDVSISDELLMNIQRLRRSSSPDLPSTVIKLETAEGCKVYLVGTAHFSKESQEDVEKVCCQYSTHGFIKLLPRSLASLLIGKIYFWCYWFSEFHSKIILKVIARNSFNLCNYSLILVLSLINDLCFCLLQTIQAVQPDIVLVELCKSRVDILKYDEEFLLREAKNIDMQKLKLAVKQVSKVIVLKCCWQWRPWSIEPNTEFLTMFYFCLYLPEILLSNFQLLILNFCFCFCFLFFFKSHCAHPFSSQKKPLLSNSVVKQAKPNILIRKRLN